MNRLQTLTENNFSFSALIPMPQPERNAQDRNFFGSPSTKFPSSLIQFPVRPIKGSGIKPVEEAKRILASGDYVGARQFVEQALVQSPDDEELQKLKKIISPPEVRVSSTSVSSESIVANRQWLKEHSNDFQGQWVALRAGELVGNAESLDEIERNVGSLKGLFVTRVF